MKVSARSYLTYGIATLGATALVAAPITPITPTPPDVVRSVERAVTNAVSLEDLNLAALLDLDSLDLESLDLDALLESLDLGSLDLDSVLEELLGLIPGLSDTPSIGSGLGDFIGSWQILFDALGVALGGGVIPGVPPLVDPGLFPFIGDVPGLLLGLIEGVIADPATLPNALSAIVYGLLYPLPVEVGPGVFATASLLSIVATPIVGAIAQILPPALAGPFVEAFGAIGEVLVGVLGILPNPGPPFPATSGGLFDGLLDGGLFDGLLDGGLFDGLLDGGLFDGLLGGDPAAPPPPETDPPGIGSLLGGGLSGGGLFGGLFSRADESDEVSLSLVPTVEPTANEGEAEVVTGGEEQEPDDSDPDPTPPARQRVRLNVQRPSLDMFSGSRARDERATATGTNVNGEDVEQPTAPVNLRERVSKHLPGPGKFNFSDRFGKGGDDTENPAGPDADADAN